VPGTPFKAQYRTRYWNPFQISAKRLPPGARSRTFRNTGSGEDVERGE
jgi:hypothetical protein